MAIHVGKNGPATCPAKIQCRLLGPDGKPAQHFDTPEEAQRAYDEMMMNMSPEQIEEVVSSDKFLNASQEAKYAQNITLGNLAKDIKEARKNGQDFESDHMFAESLKEMRDSDLDAMIAEGKQGRDKLIESNQGLVGEVAKKYYGSGVEYEDLVQEGMFGLIKAADTFDPEKGRFTTHATWLIRQSMQVGKDNTNSTIKVPRYMQDLVRKTQRDAVDGERVDVDYQAQNAMSGAISFSTPIGDDDSEFGATLRDSAESVDSKAMQSALKEELNKAMEVLNEREKSVIQLRFGLGEGGKSVGFSRTLDEVGEEFGVSRERIRQLEKRAMDKLRDSNAFDSLMDFVS